jgi:hypothetical protein
MLITTVTYCVVTCLLYTDSALVNNKHVQLNVFQISVHFLKGWEVGLKDVDFIDLGSV